MRRMGVAEWRMLQVIEEVEGETVLFHIA